VDNHAIWAIRDRVRQVEQLGDPQNATNNVEYWKLRSEDKPEGN
jgi:hypothetical protein